MPATTVSEYLKQLPPDRRRSITALRRVIRKNLPPGFKEGMQYGGIGYYIPLSRYPETYNGQPLGIAGIASQKRHIGLYLMTVYGNPKLDRWFREAWTRGGHKLNMGKSCVRFKDINNIPLDVVGEVISKVSVDEYIEIYEQSRAGTQTAKKKTAKKKTSKKKTAQKKTSKKKAAKKKTAQRKTTKRKTATKKTAQRKTTKKKAATKKTTRRATRR